jgi:hypothetical protein
MDEIKNDILRFIADRAPNDIGEDIILRHLAAKYSHSEIKEALNELKKESKLSEILIPSGIDDKSEVGWPAYSLTSYENIPIRRTIKVGETLVPRVLKSNMVSRSLEDINEAIEMLSEYSASLEKRFTRLVDAEMKKQRANLILLFGIFVAVFSFVIVGLPRITYPPSHTFAQIVLASIAQLIPIALIFAIFIGLLWYLFAK